MRAVIKMTGKGETKTVIEVKLTCPKGIRTRDEIIYFKRGIQDRLHNLLKEVGYFSSEIRIIR